MFLRTNYFFNTVLPTGNSMTCHEMVYVSAKQELFLFHQNFINPQNFFDKTEDP